MRAWISSGESGGRRFEQLPTHYPSLSAHVMYSVCAWSITSGL